MRRVKYKGVRPCGNHAIEIDFYYKDERYKEYLYIEPSKPNMQHALRYRRQVLDAIGMEVMGGAPFDLAKWFPQSKRLEKAKANGNTLKDVLTSWFSVKQVKLKHSAHKSCRLIVKYWQDKYGHVPAADFSRTHILEAVTEMQARRLELKTVHNKLLPLRQALAAAVLDGKIPYNPFSRLQPDDITKPEWEQIQETHDEEEDAPDPFDWDEIQKIKNAWSGTLLNMFLFGIWSGLRPGEIFALAWEDVDLTNRTIWVRRSRTEGVLGMPKSNKRAKKNASVRKLKLLPPAWDALMAQRPATAMLPATECGEFGKLHFVFYRPRVEKPWTDDQQLRREYERLLPQAGVRYRSPYHTRHTFASLCITAGEDKEWLRRYMGHSTVAMLDKHYAHWLEQTAAAIGREGGAAVAKLWQQAA